MKSQLELIEDEIKKLLLKEVTIELRNRIVASGRIQFYDFKDFNYKLIFDNSKKFEFPYPFDFEIEEDKVIFLYYNKILHCDNLDEKELLSNCINNSKNRFYNSKLIIKI